MPRPVRSRSSPFGENGNCCTVLSFPSTGQFPEAQGGIAAAGYRMAAVRRESHGAHLRLMAQETAQLLARLHVPEPDDAVNRDHGLAVRPEGAVPARGEGAAAVGCDGDALHETLVPDEAAQPSTPPDVPQPDRTVPPSPRQGEASVGAEGHTSNRAPVALEAAQLVAGLHVPERDGGIFAAGQCPPTVPRDGDTRGRVLSRAEAAQLLACPHVPQPEGLVPRAAGECPPAVRGERDALHRISMSPESPNLLPGLDVPQANGFIRSGRETKTAVRRNGDAVDRGGVS